MGVEVAKSLRSRVGMISAVGERIGNINRGSEGGRSAVGILICCVRRVIVPLPLFQAFTSGSLIHWDGAVPGLKPEGRAEYQSQICNNTQSKATHATASSRREAWHFGRREGKERRCNKSDLPTQADTGINLEL